VNLNEDKPTLSAVKMKPNDSSFCQYKVYADIRGGSVERGVKRHWGCRKRQFSVGLLSLAVSSEALELKPKLLCSII